MVSKFPWSSKSRLVADILTSKRPLYVIRQYGKADIFALHKRGKNDTVETRLVAFVNERQAMRLARQLEAHRLKRGTWPNRDDDAFELDIPVDQSLEGRVLQRLCVVPVPYHDIRDEIKGTDISVALVTFVEDQTDALQYRSLDIPGIRNDLARVDVLNRSYGHPCVAPDGHLDGPALQSKPHRQASVFEFLISLFVMIIKRQLYNSSSSL
jgi:hypothetical protein